ncbi:MAG: PD40 domain-containing protein [Chlamydiia bacterium]|nr:PD40 domain-containing protein [Chlamydiia bacterium]
MLKILALLIPLTLFAREPLLSNIKQLTSPENGFEKAGEAYFSPDGKLISFQAVTHGGEGYQIFILELSTGNIHKVSGAFKSCTCSFFHPDGKRILFAASPEVNPPAGGKYRWDFTPYMNLYETNLAGSELKQLTSGPAYHAECAYSPDGQRIVYASNEEGSMNLYVMNRDGSALQKITDTDDCYNGGPFFSPDGKRIVFRADREKKDLLQIYLIDADGGNLKQLTDNKAVNWAPFWHPSGEYIAYTTSLHGHHRYEIYLLELKSGKEFRITDHAGFDGLPSFNAVGTKLLWTSKRGPDGTSQIFIADFTLPGDQP